VTSAAVSCVFDIEDCQVLLADASKHGGGGNHFTFLSSPPPDRNLLPRNLTGLVSTREIGEEATRVSTVRKMARASVVALQTS
jgi:hypothetical protein